MPERCPTCGHPVTVVPAGAEYAAWCGCSMVSSADPKFRGTGRGATAEDALQRWREGAPKPR